MCRFIFAILIGSMIWIPGGAKAEDIKDVESKSGIHGYLIEDRSNPLISLAIGFKAGWAYEPKGKEGITDFLDAMLTEGAATLDASAFQRELADNGIDLSIDVDADDFNVTMTFLTEEKDHALTLLGAALSEPRFDKESMIRVRRQLLASQAQDKNDPDRLSSKALQRLLYPDHPYGKAHDFSKASLNAIAAEDLRQFLKRFFTRDRITIAAAGDLSQSEFTQLMDRLLNNLPEKSSVPPLLRIRPSIRGGIALIKRDLPQSVIAFAQPGIALDDPDFYAAYLMNYILGAGGFESRLMKEIRVKRGLSYGIDTDLVNRDASDFLFGNVQTKKESTSQTIDLIKEIWKDLHDHGLTQEELEAARTYVLGYYPQNFATLESSARILLSLQQNHLGKEYPELRQEKFKAVRLEDVNRVAHDLLTPDQLLFVITGNPSDIQPSIPLSSAVSQ